MPEYSTYLTPRQTENINISRYQRSETSSAHDAVRALPPRKYTLFIDGPLGEGKYALDTEVPYEITEGECGWSGYIDCLSMPLYGDTREEIEESVGSTIVEYYEMLLDIENDKLGFIPRIHKAILKDIVKDA